MLRKEETLPAAIDRCVNSLLAKWKKDPSSRPAPREKGQDAKSQAWAICSAAHKKSVAASLELMLEGGNGPTLIGGAATNRPYIPHLKPTEVIDGEDGEKRLRVHLANSGHFNHPTGPFTLNRAVFSLMITNHQNNVLGQDAAYDCRHRPDDGAYGWFERLMLGDEIGKGGKEFWGLVKPTEVGLKRIESGEYKYSSMEFHRNFQRDDVVLDLEDITDDVCLVDLERETSTNEDVVEDDMPDKEMEKVTLELKEAKEKLAQLEADRETVEEKRKAAEQRALEQERLAKEATDRAVALQQAAVESEITATIELAKVHRDSDGNALPRQFIEWVSSFLKFGDVGSEEDGIVRLEEGTDIPGSVRKYCIAAVRSLVLSMPGMVPAERQTHSGPGGGEDDDFDYAAEWEED